MKVPLLDLTVQYKTLKQEMDQKILEVVDSQKFILGPEVSGLEERLASYAKTRFAVGVSSGSDALIVSLMSLDIGEGDAVVTTPFTFFATVGAIVRVGARVVFCDIDETTYNMDPDKLEEAIQGELTKRPGSKVKAVIPIHLFGQCADMDPISASAARHGLAVIEDAAQAIGANYPSSSGTKNACGMGDTGVLSFFPSKNLGGYGDGGMILTDREDLAERAKILRGHGAQNKYFHDVIGGNFRLDAIQAAVLQVKLRHLDDWTRKRQKNALLYDMLFADSGLIAREIVKIPQAVYKKSGIPNYHVYNQYVVRVEKRDELQRFLSSKEVGSAIYYPLSLHLQKCFSSMGYKEGDFPVTEKATAEVLALPVFPELSSNQLEYVVSCIEEFYKGV